MTLEGRSVNPLRGGGIYYISPTFNEDLHEKNIIKIFMYVFGEKKS